MGEYWRQDGMWLTDRMDERRWREKEQVAVDGPGDGGEAVMAARR